MVGAQIYPLLGLRYPLLGLRYTHCWGSDISIVGAQIYLVLGLIYVHCWGPDMSIVGAQSRIKPKSSPVCKYSTARAAGSVIACGTTWACLRIRIWFYLYRVIGWVVITSRFVTCYALSVYSYISVHSQILPKPQYQTYLGACFVHR